MASVRLSAEARTDYDAIMDYLEREGGPSVAERYRLDFIAAFDRITEFPGSGAPREKFGPNTRLLVIGPYSIYYEEQSHGDAALAMRIDSRHQRTHRRRRHGRLPDHTRRRSLSTEALVH